MGGGLKFSERGNKLVIGNAVEKNLTGTEVHIPSCVWFLITYLGAIDGCNPE